MSKYRIVKHRAGDIIGYCPEIWECTPTIGKRQESWKKLAGNENLTFLDLWVRSLPETIEEAKSIIEKHIEDQKPKYSEEVVYEYDTKKKEQQKKLLTEIMESDQKNGLYDISGEQKKMTAVEWLINQLKIRGYAGEFPPHLLFENAKEMEKKQNKITENTSDGYHTFKELYDFRMLYNAELFNEWALQNKYEVHKSWKHNDGELCLGGGWFIVVAILPTGQISNHYSAEHWDLFKIPVTEKSLYPFDGHTSQDVINRLKNL